MQDTEVAPGNDSGSSSCRIFELKEHCLQGSSSPESPCAVFLPPKHVGHSCSAAHFTAVCFVRIFSTTGGINREIKVICSCEKASGGEVGQRVYMGTVDLDTRLFNTCFSAAGSALFNFFI